MIFKLLKKEIVGNIGRFASIALTTLIGVAFLSGFWSGVPDMEKTADDYYINSNFHDIKINSDKGFTKQDLKAIEDLDYVKKAQAVYSFYCLAGINEAGSYTTYVKSVNMDTLQANDAGIIDTPQLIEGSYPVTNNTCLMVRSAALKSDVKIGDRIYLTTNTDNCTTTVFTVTGFVSDPEFTSGIKENAPVGSSKTEMAIYVSENIFVPDAMYNEILLKLNTTLSLSSFGKKYASAVQEAKTQLSLIGEQRSSDFSNDMSGQYQNDVDKAQRQYEYIKSESEGKLKSLKDAIASAEKRIPELETEIEAAKADLQQKKQELDKVSANAAGRVTSGTASAAGETGSSSSSSSAPSAPAQDSEYEKALAAYNSAQETLNQKEKELDNKRNSLVTYKAEYTALEKTYEQRMNSAERNLEQVTSDGSDDYTQAWYVYTRDDNVSYKSFVANLNKIKAMAFLFPLLFYSVAIAAVLSTVTHTFTQQRKRMGLMLAQGLNRKTVFVQNCAFVLSATLAGSVVGCILGITVLPQIMYRTYSVVFDFPPIKIRFVPYVVLGSIVLTVLLVLAVSVLKLKDLIKQTPASLIQQKQYVKGKKVPAEKGFICKRLNIQWKTAVRNVSLYKGRAFVSLLSIAGFTALIFASFGILNSVSSLENKQHNLQPYDVSVQLRVADYTSKPEIMQYLENGEKVSDYTYVHTAQVKTLVNDKTVEITVYAPTQTDKFTQFIKLDSAIGKNELGSSDVIVSRNFAKQNKVKKGDGLTFIIGGKQTELTVTAIVKNYIGNFAVVGSDIYSGSFADGKFTPALLIKNGSSVEDTAQQATELMGTGDVGTVNYTADTFGIFKGTAERLTKVIIMLIITAGVLCVAVLYSAADINICERTAEFARLQILGCGKSGAAAYVYRENAIIAALGLIIGLIAGVILNTAVMSAADMSDVMFSRSISLVSFAAAIAAAVVFVLILNTATRIRIGKISAEDTN